jgi:hypothetical protein
VVLVVLILKVYKLLIGIEDIRTLLVLFARYGVSFIMLLILDGMLGKRF